MENLKIHITQILEYFGSKKQDFNHDAYWGASFFKDDELTIKLEMTLEEHKTKALIKDFLKEKKGKELISYSLTREYLNCSVKDLNESENLQNPV